MVTDMKTITFSVKVRSWKDKATGSWIIYSRKYDISAYGETKAKAKQMFDVVLSEMLMHTKPNGVSNKKK